MARPENIKDIAEQDRFVRIATFEIDKVIGNAKFLKHYTALLEVVQNFGGHADKAYSTMDLYIPKNDKELADQLRSDQYQWDDAKKYYNLAVNRGPDSDEIPEWRRSTIVRWAKENDLPDPFDVFAANDPELQELRAELGMENDD